MILKILEVEIIIIFVFAQFGIVKFSYFRKTGFLLFFGEKFIFGGKYVFGKLTSEESFFRSVFGKSTGRKMS